MQRLWKFTAALFACGMIVSGAGAARTTGVDETRLVTLPGNTRLEALDPANDRGIVSDSLELSHMLLVLKRPPARELAFETMVGELTDRTSPNYRRWLSAREIGDKYGPAEQDIAVVRNWLASQGFAVNRVYPSRLAIDFSGDAGKVREAFYTEIHKFDVDGQSHIANVSDPRIPASFAPVIEGICVAQRFPWPYRRSWRPAWTVDNCGLGNSDLVPNCYFVTPPDLATIYDLGPLFKNKNTGTGETIAVVEDFDIYSASDWTMFRSLFGLSGYTNGSVASVHPGNCTDPGTNGDDFEAILDAEYSSAAAPDAAIQVASCASSKTTWGLTIAVENLVNETSPPPIISASYIWCEADAGKANNKAYYDAWQQAAAEGISVFVSSGDEGAAACDYGKKEASNGIAVNGLASTPYNVAVGGTDFGDTYEHQDSTYWSSTNSTDYGSALSYVPEIPWNSSCASELIANYVTGSKVTYGTNGFCNVSKGASFITTYAGGGGPSACALKGCKGYPKPSWQSVLGNPADKLRDIPDVALFSAGPVWGHAYVVCFSDPAHDFGAPCKDFPNSWIYGYGTSFASPIMAGVQALVDQSAGAAREIPIPRSIRWPTRNTARRVTRPATP